MTITLTEIGFVENNVQEQTDLNWGSVESRIALHEAYSGGLAGLAGFTHAIVVTLLHEAKFASEKHLQRRPRNLADMPLVGIFSQRAKDRPNPIGITAVEIAAVEGDTLIVKGLDAINGTPVPDIKPYYPQYDRMDNAKVPEWVIRLMENYF